MRKVAISLLLLAICDVARGAAPASGPREALLSWQAPTKMTDNSNIPAGATLSYRVYHGTSRTICGTTVLTTVTTLQVLLTNQPLGLQCYCVTALLNGSESTPAGPGCKTMRLPAPTEGAIEAPTEGSIER